jgi:uncharacterized FlgJ-related protein
MRFLILLIIMTVQLRSLELNDTNLARCIVALKIENKELAFKQAIYESGHLKSMSCRKANNIFGMKFNKRGLCNGIKYGHASYPTWTHSVIDYYFWQKRYKIKNYNKNKDYLKRVNRIKIKSNIKKILCY